MNNLTKALIELNPCAKLRKKGEMKMPRAELRKRCKLNSVQRMHWAELRRRELKLNPVLYMPWAELGMRVKLNSVQKMHWAELRRRVLKLNPVPWAELRKRGKPNLVKRAGLRKRWELNSVQKMQGAKLGKMIKLNTLA